MLAGSRISVGKSYASDSDLQRGIISGTVAWERATDASGQVVQYKGHTYSSSRVQIPDQESGTLYYSSSRPLLSPVQSTFIGTAARGLSFQKKKKKTTSKRLAALLRLSILTDLNLSGTQLLSQNSRAPRQENK
jgi:hypothetical protein